ncbi:8555_t:CDS:2 [Racocetra fulgida]|uniref:8555_t:CDS:1 n=1 Tax=Racocetra fulgida TaxID=60492 RepID=A0A9N9A4P3_9GLOM|nr:8555_t:CDS:2 [Racocetra fulgida]
MPVLEESHNELSLPVCYQLSSFSLPDFKDVIEVENQAKIY